MGMARIPRSRLERQDLEDIEAYYKYDREPEPCASCGHDRLDHFFDLQCEEYLSPEKRCACQKYEPIVK
jgi:hypothetical protein